MVMAGGAGTHCISGVSLQWACASSDALPLPRLSVTMWQLLALSRASSRLSKPHLASMSSLFFYVISLVC